MLLRNVLLFLSRRPALRKWVENSRVTRPVVRRFVAGETLEAALDASRRLQADGFLSTLDRLGENVRSAQEADASMEAGIRTLEQIHTLALPATISIKLTQFGLDLSRNDCRQRVARLVETAKAVGTRVEIDMESSGYVDRTLDMVREMHALHRNVRAVIQAYLYRSEPDIDDLCRDGIPVRLCKGAYLEPPEVAFARKRSVDQNYRALMKRLFENGKEPALATHDPAILAEAVNFIKSGAAEVDGGVEFQMLYGVRRDLQKHLVAQGLKLRLYVPYGAAWYPYFMRRIAERPANVVFLLKSLVRA